MGITGGSKSYTSGQGKAFERFVFCKAEDLYGVRTGPIQIMFDNPTDPCLEKLVGSLFRRLKNKFDSSRRWPKSRAKFDSFREKADAFESFLGCLGGKNDGTCTENQVGGIHRLKTSSHKDQVKGLGESEPYCFVALVGGSEYTAVQSKVYEERFALLSMGNSNHLKWPSDELPKTGRFRSLDTLLF